MSSWFEPLPDETFKDSQLHLHWLATNGCFPKRAFIFHPRVGRWRWSWCLFMEHIDRNVRNIVPPGTTFALCLGGYALRNEFRCLELCVSKVCEIIQSPANTSHFCSLAVRVLISVLSLMYRKHETSCARRLWLTQYQCGSSWWSALQGIGGCKVVWCRPHLCLQVCGQWTIVFETFSDSRSWPRLGTKQCRKVHWEAWT